MSVRKPSVFVIALLLDVECGERRTLDVIFGREVFFRTFLAERPRGFSFELSAGIHLGEFFLGREIFCELSWPRGFSFVLSAGIHLGWILPWPRGFLQTLLAKRFFFRILDRDSLGWILPWPRGFLSNSLGLEAERFSFLLSAGIHLGEFFLGREVFFQLSWPRGFSFVLSAGIHLGEFFLGREVFFRTLLT